MTICAEQSASQDRTSVGAIGIIDVRTTGDISPTKWIAVACKAGGKSKAKESATEAEAIAKAEATAKAEASAKAEAWAEPESAKMAEPAEAAVKATKSASPPSLRLGADHQNCSEACRRGDSCELPHDPSPSAGGLGDTGYELALSSTGPTPAPIYSRAPTQISWRSNPLGAPPHPQLRISPGIKCSAFLSLGADRQTRRTPLRPPELTLASVLAPSAARDGGLKQYERLLAPARERFAAKPGILAVRSTSDDIFLEAFLLHFCALGSRMTEPVERWIVGAARRCAAIGMQELARALTAHARAEAGHHLMMIADVRTLSDRWNARRRPSIDADQLLRQPPSRGVTQYCNVHEENLSGDTPYAQIAIEYEVEMLPLRYGELFIGRCVEALGTEILPCLSFVTEHIVLDLAHTKFNARAMAELLDRQPSCMPALVAAGTAVLDAYGQFLTDCAQLAERDARQSEAATEVRSHRLSWQLRAPPGMARSSENRSLPAWLKDARSLRGFVLFDHGRRPGFMNENGCFFDDDPIDLHSYHVLAYDGSTLVGCVRVYPLVANGPASTSQRTLGNNLFAELLNELGFQHIDVLEIGRWTAHPEYRSSGRLGTQLAAASAALALTLARDSASERGIVLCAVGTRDRQDLMLARIGLTPVPTAEPIRSADYNDDVRMMYCISPDQLNGRFLRLMKEMAQALGVAASG